MARIAVLIRGINVGKAKRVPMPEFRNALEVAGFEGVSTVLASGNVVVDAVGPAAGASGPTAAAAKVEAILADEFEVEARCLARTADEIEAVIAGDPFTDVATEGSKYLAIFLSDALPPELAGADGPLPLDAPGVAIGDGLLYQWCEGGVLAAEPLGD